jgi:hypothetical protein
MKQLGFTFAVFLMEPEVRGGSDGSSSRRQV